MLDATPTIASLVWLLMLAVLGFLTAIFTDQMLRVLGQGPHYLGPVGKNALRIIGAGVFIAAAYSLLSGNFPHVR